MFLCKKVRPRAFGMLAGPLESRRGGRRRVGFGSGVVFETFGDVLVAMERFMLRKGLWYSAALAVFGGLIVSAGDLLAQLPAEQQPEFTTSGKANSDCVPVVQDSEVVRLVRSYVDQLASPDFNERERAMAALLKVGDAALLELEKFQVESVEAQSRIEKIVARLETERFERLSRSFLLDADPGNSYGLPAWGYYSQLVGASRTSKLLFLDMIREQPYLASSIDVCVCKAKSHAVDSSDRLQALVVETAEISSRLHNDRLVRMIVPDIGDLVAVLLATSLFDGQAPVEVNELLCTCAHSVPVSTYMQRRGYSHVLRELYALWIPKTHQSMAYDALDIALRDGHSTGVLVARQHLSSHYDVGIRERSIQCIARFGDDSDHRRLLPLMDDHTVCGEYTAGQLLGLQGIEESNEPPPLVADVQDVPQEPVYECRICDLALASSMYLANAELTPVFPSFVFDEKYVIDPLRVAIKNTPEQRSARSEQLESWKGELATLLASQPQ